MGANEKQRLHPRKEMLMPKWPVLALAALVVIAFVLWRFLPGTQSPAVVVYVSHDQVFSEPILRDFEKETGIKVRAIYDTEETRSTGAMNRLIAEKNNPQADVYWANEPIRAEVLRQQGIAAPHLSRNAEGIPALHAGVEGPPELQPIDKVKTTQVNYAEIAAKLQAIQPFLKRWVESGS
jgi:ABC-type thiamine transport system substrate-binding protein